MEMMQSQQIGGITMEHHGNYYKMVKNLQDTELTAMEKDIL